MYQCWTAAGHAAGCGEGHIMVAPNTTVLAPPAWAQKMAAEAYRDISTQVHIVPNNGATNLTAVAMAPKR